MLCPGRPPNTAIVVLCRSFMSVLNKAHVDAQFPLVTEIRSHEVRIHHQAKQSTNGNVTRIERR
jgi:hypothetical protein